MPLRLLFYADMSSPRHPPRSSHGISCRRTSPCAGEGHDGVHTDRMGDGRRLCPGRDVDGVSCDLSVRESIYNIIYNWGFLRDTIHCCTESPVFIPVLISIEPSRHCSILYNRMPKRQRRCYNINKKRRYSRCRVARHRKGALS